MSASLPIEGEVGGGLLFRPERPLVELLRVVGDMDVASLAVYIALGDAYLAQDEELAYGAPQSFEVAILGVDVGRHAAQVIAVLRAAHLGIERGAAVAAAHDDGRAVGLAHGVEHRTHEGLQVDKRHRIGRVVDAVLRSHIAAQ